MVVIDIGDKIAGVDERYNATTNPNNPGPIKRSIFVIKKVDCQYDKLIRYGDKVTIEINPYMFRRPLFLTS